MTFELPYPPARLNPNGQHGHWRTKQTAAKSYRADCMTLCRAQGVGKATLDRAHLTIRFCPPDRRRRDLDNMLSAFKQGIDAISESIGIDDSHFGLTILRGEPVKGGKVVVTVGEA
tara:strand:+ start:142 stop:489 length:348 start_codon:yes stop_codon:yes gene_type:complete